MKQYHIIQYRRLNIKVMEQEILLILQALVELIEKHPQGCDNKEWLLQLIYNSLMRTSDTNIEADLIYNTTLGENILANLLAVNIKTIVKTRILQKLLNRLWEEKE